jgi:four helix bundle protein
MIQDQNAKAKFQNGRRMKEAKECAYWLRLIRDTNEIERIDDVNDLIAEAEELTKMLSSCDL